MNKDQEYLAGKVYVIIVIVSGYICVAGGVVSLLAQGEHGFLVVVLGIILYNVGFLLKHQGKLQDQLKRIEEKIDQKVNNS